MQLQLFWIDAFTYVCTFILIINVRDCSNTCTLAMVRHEEIMLVRFASIEEKHNGMSFEHNFLMPSHGDVVIAD